VKRPLSLRLPPRHLALGLGLALAAIVLALLTLRAIGERTLRGGAAQIAVGYVQYLRDATPGLDRLFETGALDEATREQLARMRRVGEVYRFKLFDRQGRPLLVSDHLDAADPLSASSGHWPGRDAATRPYRAPPEVLAGETVLELRHGDGDADRPRTYIEAYVPAARDGRVIGIVEVYLDHSTRFARMRAALWQIGAVLLTLIAIVAGIAFGLLRRARAAHRASDARARWLAEHDALTGALNRAAFSRALAAALSGPGAGPRAPIAVLCIDLDRFRQVNDHHGPAKGDAVLRECAQRLASLVARGDLVARLGADEFAVLHFARGGDEDLARLAGHAVGALALPMEVDGRLLQVGASVGVAPWAVGEGVSVDALLHQADAAMTRAKQAGGSGFAFYDAEVDRRLEERRLLADELRGALAQGALSLHYQALFDRDGRTLIGYEALMRWKHPTRGMVPPSLFIPLAEETGLIEALGTWALREACREAAAWPGALSVSVNLSAAQFHGAQALPELVRECLAASHLPPERLVLEITESLLMSDTETVARTLNALAAMQVQIAMDDFGTGYSSLGSLWRFPFGKVKIDRAFVKDLEHDERVALVVRSIVSLAHSLSMRVTAEGVETEAQAAMLRWLGCDELQGFLLGRPTAPEALDHTGAAATRPARPDAPQWGELLTQPATL